MQQNLPPEKNKEMPAQSSPVSADEGQTSFKDFFIIAENPVDGKPKQQKKKKGLNLIKMSDVESQVVEWLWYPYIPAGKITIIQGDPGEGKTFFILGITSCLTNGTPIYQNKAQEPIHVLYQTAEDGLADTIKPRLEHLGANCKYVSVIDESDSSLSFSDDRIFEAIQKTGAKLLILDPLQAYLGTNVDMHRANETRPIFSKLSHVAEKTGCAIVIIGHMNKGGSKSSYRGLGSIDITASARSVLVIAQAPNQENTRVMAHSKSNLAPSGESLVFNYDKGFEIQCSSPLSVDELLGFVKIKRNVKQEAKEFLLQTLCDSPVLTSEILLQGEALNISERTLKTVKKELNILSEKVGDKWFWTLP